MDESLTGEQSQKRPASAGSEPPISAGKKRLPSTFHALSYRNYRILWFGQLGSSASMWMDQVMRPILVLELTDSAVQVGLISAVRLLPMLGVGILAGVVVDRFDRRQVLHAAQFFSTAIYFIMAFLVLSDAIAMWQVYITTFCAGVVLSFNQPARQSLIPSVVPREHLANAIGLNSAAVNVTRVVGAALAGVLILPLGIGGVYLINGVLMTGVLISTAMISVESSKSIGRSASFWDSLVEGLAFAAKNQAILAILCLDWIIFVFGLPYQQVFIPLFAKNVLDWGDSGVGFLVSATGAGALIGALAVATMGAMQNRGLMRIGLAVLFGLSLIGFALSASQPLAVLPFLAVGLAGCLQIVFISITNAFILEKTPPAFHGRMNGLMFLDRGLVSAGAATAGFLAAATSPQWGQAIMGMMLITGVVLVAILIPQVRKVD